MELPQSKVGSVHVIFPQSGILLLFSIYKLPCLYFILPLFAILSSTVQGGSLDAERPGYVGGISVFSWGQVLRGCYSLFHPLFLMPG